MVNGYEIHNGIAKKRAKKKENLYGTFIHGFFDSDEIRYKIFSEIDSAYKGYEFKSYKAKEIKKFADHIDKHIDIDYILGALNE